MSAALKLTADERLRADLMPLLHHVRRDPRLTHLTLGVSEGGDLRFDVVGGGVIWSVGGVSIGSLSTAQARTALSWTCQLFLAEGWAFASVSLWAQSVGPRPFRALAASI
jgi:hypothetical protein